MFTTSGATWTQRAELTASDGVAGDGFGASVALSSDGSLAVVGAIGKTVNGNQAQGAAYVFSGNGSIWTQQAELTASDGAEKDLFGYSVALSSDGRTALVGAYWKTINGNLQQGAAYVFTASGTSWTQDDELTPSDAPGFFGFSVSLSSDGRTALVGAWGTTVNGTQAQGAAYVFTASDAGVR
jgi:hypothetical protein